MANTITGKIHRITPVTEIKGRTGKPFFKRTLVLDARRYDPNTGEPKYDNYPSFEFPGDMMKELDKFSEGDFVTVSFDINGREVRDGATGETRYFNSLRGYRVEPYGRGGTERHAAEPAQAAQPAGSDEREPNDLPF